MMKMRVRVMRSTPSSHDPTPEELTRAIKEVLGENPNAEWKQVGATILKNHQDWNVPDRRVAKLVKRIKSCETHKDDTSAASSKSGSVRSLFRRNPKKNHEQSPGSKPTQSYQQNGVGNMKDDDTSSVSSVSSISSFRKLFCRHKSPSGAARDGDDSSVSSKGSTRRRIFSSNKKGDAQEYGRLMSPKDHDDKKEPELLLPPMKSFTSQEDDDLHFEESSSTIEEKKNHASESVLNSKPSSAVQATKNRRIESAIDSHPKPGRFSSSIVRERQPHGATKQVDEKGELAKLPVFYAQAEPYPAQKETNLRAENSPSSEEVAETSHKLDLDEVQSMAFEAAAPLTAVLTDAAAAEIPDFQSSSIPVPEITHTFESDEGNKAGGVVILEEPEPFVSEKGGQTGGIGTLKKPQPFLAEEGSKSSSIVMLKESQIFSSKQGQEVSLFSVALDTSPNVVTVMSSVDQAKNDSSGQHFHSLKAVSIGIESDARIEMNSAKEDAHVIWNSEDMKATTSGVPFIGDDGNYGKIDIESPKRAVVMWNVGEGEENLKEGATCGDFDVQSLKISAATWNVGSDGNERAEELAQSPKEDLLSLNVGIGNIDSCINIESPKEATAMWNLEEEATMTTEETSSVGGGESEGHDESSKENPVLWNVGEEEVKPMKELLHGAFYDETKGNVQSPKIALVQWNGRAISDQGDEKPKESNDGDTEIDEGYTDSPKATPVVWNIGEEEEKPMEEVPSRKFDGETEGNAQSPKIASVQWTVGAVLEQANEQYGPAPVGDANGEEEHVDSPKATSVVWNVGEEEGRPTEEVPSGKFDGETEVSAQSPKTAPLKCNVGEVPELPDKEEEAPSVGRAPVIWNVGKGEENLKEGAACGDFDGESTEGDVQSPKISAVTWNVGADEKEEVPFWKFDGETEGSAQSPKIAPVWWNVGEVSEFPDEEEEAPSVVGASVIWNVHEGEENLKQGAVSGDFDGTSTGRDVQSPKISPVTWNIGADENESAEELAQSTKKDLLSLNVGSGDIGPCMNIESPKEATAMWNLEEEATMTIEETPSVGGSKSEGHDDSSKKNTVVWNVGEDEVKPTTKKVLHGAFDDETKGNVQSPKISFVQWNVRAISDQGDEKPKESSDEDTKIDEGCTDSPKATFVVWNVGEEKEKPMEEVPSKKFDGKTEGNAQSPKIASVQWTIAAVLEQANEEHEPAPVGDTNSEEEHFDSPKATSVVWNVGEEEGRPTEEVPSGKFDGETEGKAQSPKIVPVQWNVGEVSELPDEEEEGPSVIKGHVDSPKATRPCVVGDDNDEGPGKFDGETEGSAQSPKIVPVQRNVGEVSELPDEEKEGLPVIRGHVDFPKATRQCVVGDNNDEGHIDSPKATTGWDVGEEKEKPMEEVSPSGKFHGKTKGSTQTPKVSPMQWNIGEVLGPADEEQVTKIGDETTSGPETPVVTEERVDGLVIVLGDNEEEVFVPMMEVKSVSNQADEEVKSVLGLVRGKQGVPTSESASGLVDADQEAPIIILEQVKGPADGVQEAPIVTTREVKSVLGSSDEEQELPLSNKNKTVLNETKEEKVMVDLSIHKQNEKMIDVNSVPDETSEMKVMVDQSMQEEEYVKNVFDSFHVDIDQSTKEEERSMKVFDSLPVDIDHSIKEEECLMKVFDSFHAGAFVVLSSNENLEETNPLNSSGSEYIDDNDGKHRDTVCEGCVIL